MNSMKFTINEKLPSLNELIAANRYNRYKGAKMKSDVDSLIAGYITQAKLSGAIHPIDCPCIISITWHERTKKRDVDNIQSSQKFILDALQQTGIIPNDSQKYVKQIYHHVEKDDRDFVTVKIETL